jgi:prepilin-type N-terminal cleavage/methylation domain-containing protein
MVNKAQQGFTLIELILFIIIIGIIATPVFMSINQTLRRSHTPKQISAASFLANARIQVILLKRATDGFLNTNDPCTGTAPPICNPLTAFATANNLTVNTSVTFSGQTALINVIVAGSGNAQLQMRVTNYEGL